MQHKKIVEKMEIILEPRDLKQEHQFVIISENPSLVTFDKFTLEVQKVISLAGVATYYNTNKDKSVIIKPRY